MTVMSNPHHDDNPHGARHVGVSSGFAGLDTGEIAITVGGELCRECRHTAKDNSRRIARLERFMWLAVGGASVGSFLAGVLGAIVANYLGVHLSLTH